MSATVVNPGAPSHLAPVTTVTASLTVADLTNGNSVTASDPTRLVVVFTNAAAAAGSVKVAYGVTPDGQTITAPAITIPVSATVVLSNWPPALFGSTLTFTYTGTMTGLTIQAYSI
jgi:hypothetical protein